MGILSTGQYFGLAMDNHTFYYDSWGDGGTYSIRGTKASYSVFILFDIKKKDWHQAHLYPLHFNFAIVKGKTDNLTWNGYTFAGGELEPVAGMAALWHTNNNWTDTPGGNDGTAQGNANFSTDAKHGSHSGNFDGNGDYTPHHRHSTPFRKRSKNSRGMNQNQNYSRKRRIQRDTQLRNHEHRTILRTRNRQPHALLREPGITKMQYL